MVYLLDEVSNQYHKGISSDVINKYQFKLIILYFMHKINTASTKFLYNSPYRPSWHPSFFLRGLLFFSFPDCVKLF